MARPSAVVLLLLLSLLAVAHCRTLESDHATADDASTAESTTGAVADGFLRLPSHRHHPCHRGLFHRHHLWWARHHGVFGDGHRFHSRGDGEPRRTEAEEEVKAVAEPDPDRSLPKNSDGEPIRRAEAVEEVKAVAEPDPDRSLSSRGDGEPRRAEAGEEVKAVAEPDPDRSLTNRDVLYWRMFRHSLRHHHRHHHHEGEHDGDHEREEEGTAGVKRFRRHRLDMLKEEEEDEEEEKKMRKLFRHDEDEEKVREEPFRPQAEVDEAEELEEMVRLFRKALARRRFRHGRFFRHHLHGRHHHHHQHAEDAEEQPDGEQQHEGGGVVTWIKGLIMNRF